MKVRDGAAFGRKDLTIREKSASGQLGALLHGPDGHVGSAHVGRTTKVPGIRSLVPRSRWHGIGARITGFVALAILMPGLALAAAPTTTAAPGPSNQSTVQVQPDTATTTTTQTESPTQVLADTWGVSPATITKVMSNKANAAALPTIPASASATWKTMPASQRKDVDNDWQQLGAHSAFDNGSALFHPHIFQEAEQGVDQSLQKGQTDQASHDRYMSLLTSASNLTKAQRTAFMAVMDADQGH